ncbi:MAG: cadherin-like beta sandwich domain-containing protein [Verrucomicrobiota bacterium]
MTRISKHLMQALAVVALVALSTGAQAATRKFALPHYLANPGGTVEVPLTLDNASGVAAIRVQINFDPEVLELQSVSAGPLGKAFEFSRGKGDGFVQLLMVRAGSLGGGSGRLAVLKFRANPGAKAKAYSDLAIADIGLSDSSGVINLRQQDSLRLKNGRVAVTLSPDIDNDYSGPSEGWKELQALSGLSLSTGKLNTGFSPSVLTYTASVAKKTASIKVKPTLADPNARVKVNGVPVKSGSRSAAIPLAIGNNSITIQIATRNGTRVKTYRIKVKRGNSPDASLSDFAAATASDGSNRTYQANLTRTGSPVAPLASGFLAAAMIHPPAESMVSRVMRDGHKYQQLTIRRYPGTPKPVVEVSPNLMDWYSGDKHTTILVDDGAILKVRDNTPVTPEAKRFIRTQGAAGK